MSDKWTKEDTKELLKPRVFLGVMIIIVAWLTYALSDFFSWAERMCLLLERWLENLALKIRG